MNEKIRKNVASLDNNYIKSFYIMENLYNLYKNNEKSLKNLWTEKRHYNFKLPINPR